MEEGSCRLGISQTVEEAAEWKVHHDLFVAAEGCRHLGAVEEGDYWSLPQSSAEMVEDL